MHRYFYAIHKFVDRNKILSAGIFVALFAALTLLAMQIRFSEDITKLIPMGDKADVTAKVLGQLNFADKITVTIHSENGASAEELARYATEFTDSVAVKCRPFVTSVQGRVDDENIAGTVDFVYDNLPLFLTPNDYDAIAKKLSQDSIARVVESNYKSILSPSGLVTRDFIRRDPLGLAFIGLNKLRELNVGDEFTIANGFVMTKDKKRLLLFLTSNIPSTETHDNALLAERLQSIRAHLNVKYRNTASASYFGPALIAVANAKQIKTDIMLSVSIAMTTLMLILMLFYRRVFIPLIIFLPTLFAAVFAVAFLYIVKGTISAISLGIGSILIGITIDYALHILTHYKHNSDVKTLYHDITMPLIMSGSTTAVAFLCLLFVNSEALQDLGIFAAVIVMASMVFSLLFVPHLYKPREDNFSHKRNVIDRLADFSFHKSKVLLYACLAIIIACFFTYGRVSFNNDLSQLNFIPKDLRAAEKDLERNTNLTSKSIYVASYGNSRDEALRANERLFETLNGQKARAEILNYSSVGGIVTSEAEQQRRIRLWETFWSESKRQQLRSNLIAEGAKVGFRPETYEPFFRKLASKFQPVPTDSFNKVAALQLGEFLSSKNGFYTVSTIVKVDDAKRDSFMSSMAKYPSVIAIDRQQLNETFLDQLRIDFNTLVNYSFVAVVLILFFFFGRIELVLISCIPIVITAIVTAGIMGIFGLHLNIFSTIVCTLIFGHGVDFSIFMTSALQKEYTDGKNEIAVYRTSIILAALTTVLGIGAMVFAHHPALTSISSVSLIGVFAALIITFIFYPMLFRFFFSGRVAKGKAPLRLFRTVHSALSFAYFGVGGFVLSVIGAVLVKIIPARREKKLHAFHTVISKFMHSVLLTYPQVSKKILNPGKESFEKPAIIIANHSSFLDILAIGQLSPKIIFLVSDWVYKSPVFGKGVRLAGFYPVSEGLDKGIGHLREKVAQGFSLVIFPEGTRSPDNSVRRFHKGAFYLAEQFGIDIVPVIIHGYSEVIPKGDFVINSGDTTIEILPRISADDARFGSTYAERTKKINAWFREEFRKRRTLWEAPTYFQQKLLGSFDYKSGEVWNPVRKDVLLNMQLYNEVGKAIPEKARIAHIADNYGQVDIFLALQHPQRNIKTFIADEEKRSVAMTNYLVKKRLIHYTDTFEALFDQPCDILLITTPSTISAQLISKATRLIALKGCDVTFANDAHLKIERSTENFTIWTNESAL